MEKHRRIDWNLGCGARTSPPSRAGRGREDRVSFSGSLSDEENLTRVIQILFDFLNTHTDQILSAVNRVYHTDSATNSVGDTNGPEDEPMISDEQLVEEDLISQE